MKRKMVIAGVLVLFLVAGAVVYQNRHDIALKINTEPSMMTAFNGIVIGDTLAEVTSKMGQPVGTIEFEGMDTRYVKWPRYKGTTFAVKVVEGVVVEKHDRFGS